MQMPTNDNSPSTLYDQLLWQQPCIVHVTIFRTFWKLCVRILRNAGVHLYCRPIFVLTRTGWQVCIFNYTDALHSDDFILFTSAKVLTAEHFLQKQCTVYAAFADADESFLEQLLSG